MRLNKKPTKRFIRDIQEKSIKTRICQHLDDNCGYSTEKIDASKLPKNIYDFFTVKQNILNIAKKLWTRILKVIQQKENFIGEYICYDILNLENNEDLNYHYKTFLDELNYDATSYENSQGHNEYFDLVDRLFCSLESFLSSPLFSLENNVEHLLFTIDMPFEFNENEQVFEEKNVGQFVDQATIDFLKELKGFIFQLKFLDESVSLTKKKVVLKNRINESLKAKQYHLEKYGSTANVINPYKSTDSTTELLPEPENTSNYINKQSFNITERHDNTDNTEDYIVEPIVDDLNTSFNSNNTNILTSKLLDEPQSTSNKDTIVVGIVVTFMFLVFFIFYCVKKYNNRKKNSKNKHVGHEIEPFYDVVSSY